MPISIGIIFDSHLKKYMDNIYNSLYMRGESRAICRLIVLSSLDGLIKFYINCHMTKFPKWAVIALNKSVRGHFWMHSCNNDRLTYETGDHENNAVVKAQFLIKVLDELALL